MYGVIGAVAALVLIAILLVGVAVFCYRKGKKREDQPQAIPSVYPGFTPIVSTSWEIGTVGPVYFDKHKSTTFPQI